MRPHLVVWQFARLVAVIAVALLVAFALIHSRRGAENLTPLARDKADVPASELASCRSAGPGAPELLASCRHLWDENRRHFFASSKSSQPTGGIAPRATTFSGDRVDSVESNAAGQVEAR